ncbi:hypothetical protein HK096_000557, partial [Nowakowskiella sp. JEL0078]
MLYSMMQAESEDVSTFAKTYEWVVLVVVFFQDLAFCFIGYEWGDIGRNFGFALIMTQVERAFDNFNISELQYILAFTADSLITLLFTLTIYVTYSFITKNFKVGVMPLRVLRFIHSILATFLYLPITTSTLTLGACSGGVIGVHKTVLEGEPVDCWQGFHLGSAMITLFLVTAFIPFTYLMSLAYFDPNPRSKLPLSRSSPVVEMCDLSSKTIIVIVYVFADEYRLVRAVTLLVINIFLLEKSNYVRIVMNFELVWGSIVSLPIAIYNDTNAGNILFWVWLGGVPFVGVGKKIEKTQKDDSEDFNLNLMKTLGIYKSHYKALHLTRVGFTTENFEIQDETEIVLRAVSDTKIPQLLKEDYTLSMLYFKRAAEQPKLSLFLQYVIYQAERDRRERIVENERGNQKMDPVDRVEYKQLMKRATMHHKEWLRQVSNFWKALASGKINGKSLLILVSRMEAAERSSERYYKQLYSRFSYIPKVLLQYSNFLDVSAKLEEAEEIRQDLRELIENGLDIEEESEFTEIKFGSQTLKSGRKKEISMRSAVSSIPNPPLRSNSEKIVHRIYRRLVTDHQAHSKKKLSRRIFIFVFGIISTAATYQQKIIGSAKIASVMISLEDKLNKEIYVSDSSLQFQMKNVQTNISNNISTLFNNSQSMFYVGLDNGWVGDIFTSKNTQVMRYFGFDYPIPFQWEYVNLIDLTNEYLTRLKDVSNKPLTYFFTPYIINITDSNGTITKKTLKGEFLIDLDYRFITDNTFIIANGFNSITESMVQGNERGMAVAQAFNFSVWGFAMIMLVIVGACIFRPIVELAKTDRKLCVEAFLQLPKEI